MVTRQTRTSADPPTGPLPRFNGGREWLPGKPHATPPGRMTYVVLQWRPGMVTRQTTNLSGLELSAGSLQWRPGMVTRQTRPVGHVLQPAVMASMEAGNGYPANERTFTADYSGTVLQWRPGMVTRQTPPEHPALALPVHASMEAGNGYPANFDVPLGAAALILSLQWRPGMVTRQTWRIRHLWLSDPSLQWRPGMVTRQTPPQLEQPHRHHHASMEAGNGYPANTLSRPITRPLHSRFNGGREWLPGKPGST